MKTALNLSINQKLLNDIEERSASSLGALESKDPDMYLRGYSYALTEMLLGEAQASAAPFPPGAMATLVNTWRRAPSAVWKVGYDDGVIAAQAHHPNRCLFIRQMKRLVPCVGISEGNQR
jgi:hypothetical protein